MSEKSIMQEIQIEMSKIGVRLFRNNVGLFDTLDGRKMRTGLCVGSSDLIGWAIPSGRFVAIECKSARGRPTKEQLVFIDAVNTSGGIAFIARSPSEALEKIKSFNI